MESINELLTQALNQVADDIHCACPCKVVGVNGNFVDVMAYINDDEPDIILYHVPIKRTETQRAYIFLGIKEGDYGTLTFFDKDTNDYIENEDTDYNSNDEQHGINQRCFTLGFVPNPSAFVYPTDQEIEIGLKNTKFRMSINNDGYVDIYVEDDVNLEIKGNVTSKIKGNVTSTIEGDVNSTVKGDVTSTINGDYSSTIYGTSTTTVIGDASLTAPNINTTGVLNQTGAVNIVGAVAITGAVVATGEITGNSVKLSQHKHSGVTSGGDETGTPIPESNNGNV